MHLTAVFVLAALCVPYFLDVWWKFIPAIGIVIFSTKFASPRYRLLLGIDFKAVDFVFGAVVFAVAWSAAWFLIPRLLAGSSLEVRYVNLGWSLMPATQAMLEELVLRGLLLNGLRSIITKGIRRTAVVSALFFLFWHLFFFPYTEGVWLSVITLSTLLLFGYASSLFFLNTNTIAIPLALHAGWNLPKFGGEIINTVSQTGATQAGVFNAVEGNCWVLLMAAALVVVAESLAFRISRAS